MGKQAKIKAQKRRERKLNAIEKEMAIIKEAIYENEENVQNKKPVDLANEYQCKEQDNISPEKEIENDSKIAHIDVIDSKIGLEEEMDGKADISNKEIEKVYLNRDEVEEKSKLSDKQLKELDYMEISLRRNIKESRPNDRNLAGLLFNLSTILEKKGLYLQALECSNKTVELAPDQFFYKQANNRIKNAASQCKGELDLTVEAERIRAAEQSYEEDEKKREEQANKVDKNIISLNRYPSNLLQRKNSYIETKLIHSNAEHITKPIFNSNIEMTVYRMLLEFFPNYFVYPNMALQNIFDYEKAKEILDSYDFEYFLKAHVDFCIIKTSDYFPLVTLELDSHYHDDNETKKKDEIKNQLFLRGGLNLLRIRPFGQPSEETIRAEIIASLEAWRQKSLEATSN